jgi:hypothetical protein
MLLVDYGFPAYPIRGPRRSPRFCFRPAWWTFNEFASLLVETARRWQQGHVPDSKTWNILQVGLSTGLFRPWDLATLLYYYASRRTSVTLEEFKNGWTGYTGVLQEMIDEVPTRGTRRLAAKLSLDVKSLIPRYVRDPEKRDLIFSKARDIAKRHGIPLEVPYLFTLTCGPR